MHTTIIKREVLAGKGARNYFYRRVTVEENKLKQGLTDLPIGCRIKT